VTRTRLLLLAAALVAGCHKANPAADVRDLAGALVSMPETGMPQAMYQHYKRVHQDLDSMRANLRTLVAAESIYHLDSGKYTTTTSCWVPPTDGTVHWCASRGNTLDAITITPHGWYTHITNLEVAGSCFIQVGNDTSFGAPAEVPACFSNQQRPF